jgi:hypothetical protein
MAMNKTMYVKVYETPLLDEHSQGVINRTYSKSAAIGKPEGKRPRLIIVVSDTNVAN